MNGALEIHPKVAGGSLAGALALIIVWGLSLAHVAVPTEVGMAFTLVLAFAGGWAAPSKAPAA